ncbi:T9SS type B sorting domain-containing protein [Lutibacter sp. A80]|uniref:T9SS type B sorting domain-containing protein n=1 Tax=Lutibacter sp. A80 TaxID=2918453 RepID=UPI001F05B743|nr:T9SS type B sorting domain-containing protein [Lutibacter sp. A80]UMB59632.1 T9SS type B sorting domain-containing protein [Lutibacter sp. A80]
MHFKLSKFILVLIISSCFCIKNWSQTYKSSDTPPVVTATGDQSYCPLSKINIVTDFNIAGGSDQIEAIYIQISKGYDKDYDILKLLNASLHPAIKAQEFNILEGKLVLEWTGSGTDYADLIAAVKDVVFENNDQQISGERTFSITIDEKNYLPSTSHYYEFVPDIGITWSAAKDKAKSLIYNGLQGYLATITSVEEAQLIGEQAKGAGWIGGSDAETEGVWKWVTGPESGKTFWIGSGNGTTAGTDIPFAFWNSNNNEPNQAGNEDYAHITAPNIGQKGSWNDLSNAGASSGDYQPKGYIVEYGYPGDPKPTTSTSSKITISKIVSFYDAERCGAGEVILSANSSDGGVLWFDSETSSIPLSSNNTYTPTITETTTFYITPKSCTSGERTAITSTVHPLPDIKKNITIKNCDEDGNPDGYTDFNLSNAIEQINNSTNNYTISFHYSEEDANTGNDAFNPDSFNNKNATNNTIYARVENTLGCFNVSTITLAVSTTSLPSGFMETLIACDNYEENDGYFAFNLTEATTKILDKLPNQNLSVHYFKNEEDALLKKNEITPQTNYINTKVDSETLFVRIENSENGDCYGIGEYLTLNVNPLPEFEVNTNEVICLDNPSAIILEPFNNLDTYSYVWTNNNNESSISGNTLEVLTSGIYTVIATSNSGCESLPKTSIVEESKGADISLDDLIIVDDSDNNSITINDVNNNLGEYDYEYSLNNEFGPFQNEPFFYNIPAGIHTLYVRDTNNCKTVSLEVSIIGYPKFFTPNNDGENDTWNIIGINSGFYPTSTLNIFDRYGKLVAKINPIIESWNGLYNGKELPSTDYWFTVELKDNTGKIRRKQGHFSLIRK